MRIGTDRRALRSERVLGRNACAATRPEVWVWLEKRTRSTHLSAWDSATQAGLGIPPGEGGYLGDTFGIGMSSGYPPSAVVVTRDRGACRRCFTERPVARALRLTRTSWSRTAVPIYIRAPGSKYALKDECKSNPISFWVFVKFDTA